MCWGKVPPEESVKWSCKYNPLGQWGETSTLSNLSPQRKSMVKCLVPDEIGLGTCASPLAGGTDCKSKSDLNMPSFC